MKFEDLSLDTRILAGVQAAGFVIPTPIQEQAIPYVLEGRDVLGLAQTGTGKTAAFMLPILNRLTRGPLRRVRSLVVAPTRELAEQIHDTTEQLSQRTKIRSTAIYGGVSKRPQLDALRRGSEIVVACPGRLLDHLGEGAIDLSHLEVFVLDEADRMFDMGFLPDIRRLLKYLPTKRQNLFFSATMPSDIRKLADEILDNPATVQIGMIAPAKTVSHALYPVPQSRKKGLLFVLLKRFETEKVLIFTRTKRRARFLARDLESRGYRVSALQGNMAQNRRQEAINGFRGNKYDILVATDIAARGIDVAEISHVINFDIPDTVDAYTHRIGRTGRAKQTGEALTFVDQADEGMVREIERVLGKRIERKQMAEFDYSFKDAGVQGSNGATMASQPRTGRRGQQKADSTNGVGSRGESGGSRSARRRGRSADRRNSNLQKSQTVGENSDHNGSNSDLPRGKRPVTRQSHSAKKVADIGSNGKSDTGLSRSKRPKPGRVKLVKPKKNDTEERIRLPKRKSTESTASKK